MEHQEVTEILIVANNALELQKVMDASIKLKKMKIHSHCVDDVMQAYYLLFGPGAETYAMVIIDNTLEDRKGFELWSAIRTQQCTGILLLVTDHQPVENGVMSIHLQFMSTEQFNSMKLDQAIIEHLTGVRQKNKLSVLEVPPDRRPELPEQYPERQAEKTEHIILNAAAEGIIGLDAKGVITYANPKACEMLDVSPESVIGRAYSEFSHDTLHEQSERNNVAEKGIKPFFWTGRGLINRPDNTFIFIEYTQSFISEQKDNTVSVLVIEDISRRMRYEKKLKKMAHTDGLTELHNRYYFERVLKQELKNPRHDMPPSLVAMVDLDGFKSLNDHYGHGTGDHILLEVSMRLQKCIRRGDLVARLGGDEFAILMQSCNKENGEQIAKKIVSSIQAPFKLGDNTFKVTCSVGMTAIGKGDDISDVMSRVDAAMYQVKHHEKNGYFFIENNKPAQNLFGEHLNECIQSEAISLVYQPRYDVTHNRMVGVEVYTRFLSSEISEMPVKNLFEAATQSDLATRIDSLVMQQALRQLYEWQQKHTLPDGFRLAINISGNSLDDFSLAEQFAELLSRYQLSGNQIELEFNEELMTHLKRNHLDVLYRFGELGAHIAVDNFGSTYSAFNPLKNMYIDTVKIDRSITDRIETSSEDQALVSMLLNQAKAFKLSVIVMGVEKEEQLNLIKSLGCCETQGFLWGHPVSATNLFTGDDYAH